MQGKFPANGGKLRVSERNPNLFEILQRAQVTYLTAPLKIASKRVWVNLFTHKASESNFNQVKNPMFDNTVFDNTRYSRPAGDELNPSYLRPIAARVIED